MTNRTDLAVESYESVNKTAIDGVIVKEDKNITTVEVINDNGAQVLGKPIGTYITYSLPSFLSDIDLFDGRLQDLSSVLNSLLPEDMSSVLVAGVGNLDITADALGPKVNDYVIATRHLMQGENKNEIFKDFFNVSNIPTGVLGDTGIESAELVGGIVSTIKPSCVIVVDALAATSKDRLGSTVQMSNTGISPGSGVGNHRYEISEKTLGIPVISMGIPTVLSTALLDDCSDGSMFVTPREIDRIIEQGSKLIGMSINTCLHKNLSPQDLFSLVG
ncbi:MAG: GPR endopeptidase [Eubacterium sp.]|nr:GPR endopeptidase [Eubacterium sp.]